MTASIALTSRRAFTLFELLIVIGMLSVAAAIVMPVALNRMDDHQIRQTAAAIQHDLNDLRITSLQTGSDCEMQFSDRGTAYTLIRDSIRGKLQRRLPQGLQLRNAARKPHASNRICIRFHSDGTSNGQDVQLVDKGGQHLLIAIDRLTSEVLVERGLRIP